MEQKKIISVIVPVYNVEPYLRECLDSIVNQTYKALEILVIDDGSTDGSGSICDEYKKKDDRIRVFHTENRGLSAARNLGLDEARGEFIGFVDSDDWIELGILEQAISKIGEADILCFGYDRHPLNASYYSGKEALVALTNGNISNAAWDKLYKKDCFSSFRFPEGRVHEETATTYKLLYQSSYVICINECGYHYRNREGSISSSHSLCNLIDFWTANVERYDYCKNLVDEDANNRLLQSCAYAIARAWAWKDFNTKEIYPVFYKMSTFTKECLPYSVLRRNPIHIRIGCLLGRYPNKFSFWLAYRLLVIMKTLKRLYSVN